MKDYLKKVLNKQQYEAAVYVNWPSLILASAWAWKTRTLTYKIAYINSLWVWWWNILAVTFTNKAANEMKERLREIANDLLKIKNHEKRIDDNEEADLDELIYEYDNYSNYSSVNFNRIWTFHSIFLKILKIDIEYVNNVLWTNYTKYFNVIDESDAQSLIRKILKDLWVKDSFTPREIKSKISKMKNVWLTAKNFLQQISNESDEIVWKVYGLYEKLLRTQNSLDFDDLLLIPYLLFKEKQDILDKWKSKFKYILVDEAQDTNKIQFNLIRMLSWSEWNITLIWDDFQSIYWWRWAVIDDFLNANKYWNNLRIFKLETNYRSKKTIVDAWNYIIQNNKNQYKKNIIANNNEETKIKTISFETEVDEAVWVISLIKTLCQKWKKRSDFAIIYRVNAQSEPFEKVLLTENIPYKIYWAFKFYDRREVKDVLSYIKYLVNPSDWISLARIINVPWRRIWQATVEKLQQIANKENLTLNYVIENIEKYDINSLAKKNIFEFLKLINYIRQKIKNKTPAEIIEIIINNINYENYLIKEYWENDAQERMQNVWQLINTASNFSNMWIEWLKGFIDEISLLTDLEENKLEQNDKINLMTAHASKWLEFDTVFLVWLEENIFPLSKARLDPRELEEERRLAYVWVTRAKNNLFLTYAESRRQYWNLRMNPISRFVEEIPDNLKTSFNFWKTIEYTSKFKQWDKVKHKLFWLWEVLESFDDAVIVRFYNWWIKKILWRMLDKI